MCCHNGRRLALQRRAYYPPESKSGISLKYRKGGDNVNVFDMLSVIGYTITVFSFGYALGRDLSKKQR